MSVTADLGKLTPEQALTTLCCASACWESTAARAIGDTKADRFIKRVTRTAAEVVEIDITSTPLPELQKL
ncbi:hypothetical protein [Sphingomonas olei]|uniref:hypothetical protein n=1 Tax=Sphingomonas olei TaxID=1886787 RepID=UPI0014555992|nr:hypothetical protein [Sphingomonas olei]